MKRMRTIPTLLLALLLAVSLCACGTSAQDAETDREDLAAETDPPKTAAPQLDQSSQESTAKKPLAVTTVSRPDYHLDLPETVAWEAGEGDLDLMKEGKVVGGVWALDYTRAESLRDPAVLDGAIPAIVEAVAPSNNAFSLFDGAYGDFSIGFVQEGGNTVHTFFAQGDTLFDVWVLDERFNKEETETIFGSFTLEEKGLALG